MKNTMDDFKIPSFKEVYGDYNDYLLQKLNRGESLESADFDLKKLSRGFAGSSLYFLHNTYQKKTIVTAFHIPDKEEKVHHYDLHLVRFCRKKKSDPWERKEVKELRDTEVQKLYGFIEQQNKFIGRVVDKLYYKILSTDTPATLQDLDLAIDLILKNKQVDFKQLEKEGINKLLELLNKILEGENIVLEKGLYEQLVKTKTNKKSLKLYKKDVEDFKGLVNNGSSTETDMQDFLETRVWFFGLSYIQCHRRSIPKFNSSLGTEYDFLLERFNQVYDIVELKGPNDLLFEVDKVAGRKRSVDDRVDYKFSTKFSRALHQVMSYMDEFETSFGHIKENQPSLKDFMYPKGTIVLSKRVLFPNDGKNSIKYLHLINRQFSNIDILTYNDLIDRAQITIDFIENINRPNKRK